MSDTAWDKEKGELLILGRRHTAIDAQALCDFLDSLVGKQVAEVIIHNLEFRLGKMDAARKMTETPQANLAKIIDQLTLSDRLSGIGKSNVILAADPADPIRIEVVNPSVKGATGAAKAFVFSWWAGALTILLDREVNVREVVYDEKQNKMIGVLGQRSPMS